MKKEGFPLQSRHMLLHFIHPPATAGRTGANSARVPARKAKRGSPEGLCPSGRGRGAKPLAAGGSRLILALQEHRADDDGPLESGAEVRIHADKVQ